MSTTPSRTGTDALDAWLARLADHDLPILGRTVRQLCRIASDTQSSTQDLAMVVLQDASLTSGVLRAANSAFFNRTGQEISTISRAIVLLGFDAVRTIGVSLTVIDTLLRGAARERLMRIMRESVFAATQARLIAREQGTGETEHVFVAALVLRLGEMAFWCFSDEEEARAMERGLAEGDRPAGLVERDVLGFRLRELSVSLAQSWHLGALVEQALNARPDVSRGQIGCIRMGHRLEAAIRTHGLRSSETGAVVQQIIDRGGVDPSRARALLARAREEGRRVAEAFGIPAETGSAGAAPPQGEGSSAGRIHRPAPVLQLKILRELSLVLRERPTTHTVLEMILEGLHRGVGMDRTLIAIFNRERTALRVRYSVGDGDGAIGGLLSGALEEERLALARLVLAECRTVQVMDLSAAEQQRHHAEAFQHGIGGMDALLAPLVIRRRAIGLIYCDRIPSQRLLDGEAAGSVLHFADQANLALEHINDGG